MEHIFLQILNMSAAASYVIAAVLLLRLPLRKLPKKVSYPLWSVVAFRLCCPVTWQSVFSLFRLAPAASSQVTAGGGTRLEYFPVIPGNTVLQADASLPQVNEAAEHTLQAAAPVPGADPLQIAVTAGTVLWCAGIAVLLLYSVACCGKMRRQLRTAVLLRDNIYQSDRVRSPFLLGLIHPKIYIPYGLDADTLKYVLAHEQYHIRRKDYLIKPFAFLLLAVHWFNPLCWLSFHLMNRDMEMSCDEKVLSGEGTSVKAYSMTLLSFAVSRRFPSPSPLAFGEAGVKSRIKNVLRWKKPKAWMTLLAAVLCILAVIACAANPEQQAAPDPPEEQTDSVENTPVDSDGTEQTDGEGNTLLENASPSTSALTLYAYDGEAVTYGDLFHTETAQEILDSLSAVNVKKVDGWSPELITLPVYGLEIGGSDGWSVKAAWSNGYWITKEGDVYRFDYDFEALEAGYNWEASPHSPTTAALLPCARFLSRSGDRWFPSMLSPVGELSPQERITAELVSQTDRSLTVKFSNRGKQDWMYGEAFSIHVLLDGTWYGVPTMPGDFAFSTVGHMLRAGDTTEETYHLDMYGALPAGTYRLAVQGLTVEFAVP